MNRTDTAIAPKAPLAPGRGRIPLARAAALGAAALTAPVVARAQEAGLRLAHQNPSPMVETTRSHDRLPATEVPGRRWALTALPVPVRIFVPEGLAVEARPALLVHFHGVAHIPERAAATAAAPSVVASVHLAAGSSGYDAAFDDPAVLDSILTAVERELSGLAGHRVAVGDVTLSAFSAGHGAVRAILRDPDHFERVVGVLLLDGLHTGYLPPGTVLHEGGRLDASRLESVLAFAREAVAGRRRLLITHSEIFPGTFASTTETADHLLRELGLRRTAVLRWGPVGMQQLGEVRCGGFGLLAFAGNTAPDHVDHFHGMVDFMAALDRLPSRPASEPCALPGARR
ncbi:MAG: hypothetical protein GWM90_28825 [Gemmatimonadetes bacterium]|nr:hypothetical protein [Gemmatimonadota bacterium]NIQ59041.1 hypothetical protein [Gemmatimonadota bacterium]NIU79249.1 hypothetical protein [Gammaproteobacteria bacterium]NIX47930.1 hypothetical protein [Gemmatimonadota bacterium]NIY12295.1 hypothetical protein [Gemmatimonadota bacterium]